MSKNLRSINNASAYQIVNEAYKQAVGANAVDTVTLDDFCDGGVAFESLTVGRDSFLKALIDQVVTFYTEESYKREYEDPFYVDEMRFGSILQIVNAQAPEVTESHAFKNLAPTVSGNDTTYVTIGTYTCYPATVKSKYYQKSVSWELPICIAEERLTTAFRNAEELRSFTDYLFLIVDNALTQHREDLNAQNRNSFMANKILAESNANIGGIHKIDLLAKFNAERGGSLTTKEGFLKSPEALRYASSQILLYKQYLQKQSTLFNTEGLVKFCPEDRLVLEVNSAFENAIAETALSTTYHDEVVALPNHYSVPAWQGFGVTDAVAGTSATAFDQVTKIDVSVDAGDVEQTGIVALMADKYAIMHTIKKQRVASQYFSAEDVNLYWYQNYDMYINNLAQNGLVFTIEDVTTP